MKFSPTNPLVYLLKNEDNVEEISSVSLTKLFHWKGI